MGIKNPFIDGEVLSFTSPPFSPCDSLCAPPLLRAFFWLVSLLLASLVWFISVQISNKDSAAQQKGLLIFGVVLSVLLQETFRFAYYKLLK